MFMTWETRSELPSYSYKNSICNPHLLMSPHGYLLAQLHDKYQDFVTLSERDEFTATLQEVEDWLYEDGEDETKGVYVAKLEELKKVIALS